MFLRLYILLYRHIQCEYTHSLEIYSSQMNVGLISVTSNKKIEKQPVPSEKVIDIIMTLFEQRLGLSF